MKQILVTKAVASVSGLGTKRVNHTIALFPDNSSDAEIKTAISELPVKDPQFEVLPTVTFVTAQRTVLVPADSKKGE